VTQRGWQVRRENILIVNRSVKHEAAPLSKQYIRGHSIITGYIIIPDGEGSVFTYVTQTDPKGLIPGVAVNAFLKKTVAKVLDSLTDAALKYEEWAQKNKPEKRLELEFEQLELTV